MFRYLTHVRDWYRDPFRNRPNWAEKTMLLLTIGIALVYAGQYQQMKSSSQQTADLIKAANIQACAAQKIADASDRNATAAASFATSADGIKKQTEAAVIQFQHLAEGTTKVAKTASQTLTDSRRQFRVEERPYVGLNFDIIKPGDIKISMTNSGKTPAYNCHFDGRSITATIGFRVMVVNTEPTAVPIPGNGGTTSIPATLNLPEPLNTEFTNGRQNVTATGKFLYSDIYGCEHWTTFCIQFNGKSREPEVCSTGVGATDFDKNTCEASH
jgi:hypothetical protein